MSTKKKLLQAAAGSAGGAAALNVEDVFSTYLYEGNGANNYIKNDINIGNGAAENTVLHLTGDTLSDSSPFNHTMTAVGNTSVNTSTKKYGTGSIYFDGTGDYLRAEDSRFVLGSYDFTIEFWLNLPDASPTKGIFHIWDNTTLSNYSIALYHIGNDLTLQFKNGVDGTPNGSISSTTDVITNNTWHHIAAVRHNNTINLYVDGTAVSSGFDATGINLVMNYFELGTHWDSNYTFTGYIDDFRITRGTARYTSNFTTPTSALSLDTATTGEGGLVWVKNRTSSNDNLLYDTERGANNYLSSNTTSAEGTITSLSSFNANGFTVSGSGTYINGTATDYASWTFRKAPKFFDVVTYTGNATAGRTVSHNLGTTPAVIMIKALNSAQDWAVYHRSVGATKFLRLNTTAEAIASTSIFNDTEPTATEFTVGTNNKTNGNYNYVAYLFAHNDGDGEFGPTGDQDIIKCGSYTGNGAANTNVIDLGFEPQWVMIKNTSSTSGNWNIFDNMRGITTGGTDPYLAANTSDAEGTTLNIIDLHANGFTPSTDAAYVNASGSTYIYIAIRRGPMAVPTDATDVFAIDQGDTTSNPNFYAGFPVDLGIWKDVSGAASWRLSSRLIQGKFLATDNTNAEASNTAYSFDHQDAWLSSTMSTDYYSWMWKRAPNYFDVVAYTGNGTAGRTVSHNLGVAPEMIWVKARNLAGEDWWVYHSGLNVDGDNAPETDVLFLNSTSAAIDNAMWYDTAPTDSVFYLDSNSAVNGSSYNYIAYLFASLDGVSKVGSYTGNGTSQTIDCGFSSGARFVLIKRTDSTSDWWVFDTARGIVAGNDSLLALNGNAAEGTGYDNIDPDSSGFIINNTAWNENASGGSYIFYAVA